MKPFDELITELADARPDDFVDIMSCTVCSLQSVWRDGAPTGTFETVARYRNIMHAYSLCGDAEWLRTAVTQLRVRRTLDSIRSIVEDALGEAPPPGKLAHLVVALVHPSGRCEYVLQANPGSPLWRCILSDWSHTILVHELGRLLQATDVDVSDLLHALEIAGVAKIEVDPQKRTITEVMR